MLLPSDLENLLKKKFFKENLFWLQSDLQNWPVTIKLSSLTEKAFLQNHNSIKKWLAAWNQWQGPGKVQWAVRNWRTIGAQRIPDNIEFTNPLEIATYIGKDKYWQNLQLQYAQLIEQWPILSTYYPNYLNMLTNYSPKDFQLLLQVLHWLIMHPQCDLYPRQLPIVGIDSKWCEKRMTILTALLNKIQVDQPDRHDLWQRCGLKRVPYLIRIRILDPDLRKHFMGITDISISVEDLLKLNLPIANVLIVENLQTGLALDDLPGTLVIMGLGYNVDVLMNLPWLKNARCLYWGDLDSHGFAILDKARSYLPHLRSILMDQNTLLQHKELCVTELKQHAAEHLANLTPAEHQVYSGLKQQLWGYKIRLEQERIFWNMAWAQVKLALV